MYKFSVLLIWLVFACGSAGADNRPTRGIGVYPGRPSECMAPTFVCDDSYRNVALYRMVRHSSAVDANLTGQMVTDGYISTQEPCRLAVSLPDGQLGRREREKTLDGNMHTRVMAQGEDTYLQFDWSGMEMEADALHLLAEVVYEAEKATGGYRMAVMGSKDGRRWQLLGSEEGSGLPGMATRQQTSTDPNKHEARIRMAMRKIDATIWFSRMASCAHLRIVLQMAGCKVWRISKTEFYRKGRLQEAMPSAHFSSAWMSDGGGRQWLCIDLGCEAEADEVRLHWVHPACEGRLLYSADGSRWAQAAEWTGQKAQRQRIRTRFRGRYVKLVMDKPDASGCYALSEMEVMGRGGLRAVPHERVGMKDGRYYLNGGDWQLWRKGSAYPVTATVPGTVLASYMNIGAVPDTNVDDNMRQVSESYFNADFVYRTTFDAPPSFGDRHVYLHLDGINWKATVRVNGTRVGRMEGAFVRGCFEVTGLLRPQGNVLEVEVEKNAHPGAVKWKDAQSTDTNGGVLGADNPTFHASIGWDWITSTPGREVGIWDDVYLSASEGVRVQDPLVVSRVRQSDTLATMTPAVRVHNDLPRRVSATLRGWIGDITFAKPVTLEPQSEVEVTFSPDEFAQLRDRKMRLWWPVDYGEPYLYEAGFVVEVDGCVSDSLHYQAGIREMAYRDLSTQTKLYINGKRVVPLGGNWGFSENHLRYRAREYDVAVGYHKDMHLNMIRNWVGQTADREFYEACDRHGVMVWQDFWLANPWDGPNPANSEMFLANARDYLLRIRNHPSLAIYVGRNEGYPPAALDSCLGRYVSTLHPGLGYIGSSADEGVSGHGPYRAVAVADYFCQQPHKLHSERGMPCVPTYESLCRMLSPERLWPIGEAWGQHDFTLQGAQQGSSFCQMVSDVFGEAPDARRFTEWAQWINYNGYRAMYESAQQDRLGLLIWMSHSCWPSMVWQTYDYYFEPTGAYFGVKKACEPLHVQYNELTRKVQVVNVCKDRRHGLKVVAQVLDPMGREVGAYTALADVDTDRTVDVMEIGQPDGLAVWFLRLSLYEDGQCVSDNCYVESDSLPSLRSLTQQPAGQVSVQQQFSHNDGQWMGAVTLRNTSDKPALLVRLNLKGTDGLQILPVWYSDNYLMLMPGDEKTVSVSCRDEDVRGQQPQVVVSWLGQP